jgi:hypothetical protein
LFFWGFNFGRLQGNKTLMNDVRHAIMPKAREYRLIIKDLPDETLVYDLDTDEAHCLNSTAAMVWKNCDGRRSIREVTKEIGVTSNTSVDEDIVWLALEQLEKFKLLTASSSYSADSAGVNRRVAMRHLALAGLALPVIISLAAPMATSAQSCLGKNVGPCVGNPIPCCAGCTCNAAADKCQGTCA